MFYEQYFFPKVVSFVRQGEKICLDQTVHMTI